MTKPREISELYDKDRTHFHERRSGEERRTDYDPYREVRRHFEALKDENAQGWALADYWMNKAKADRNGRAFWAGWLGGTLFAAVVFAAVLWLG